MSLTAHRVIQYIVIITLCTLAGGGYWYWKDQQAKASVALKTATDTGLVAYWSFDEGSGTTAEDFSPANANTGTLTNSPTWVDGKVGKALSFDGTNDYVTMGNTNDITTGDFTLAYWMNPENVSQFEPVIIKREAVGPYRQYQTGVGYVNGIGVPVNGKQVGFFGNNGADKQSIRTTNDVVDGQWHHVTVTRTSSGILIYIDGVSVALTVESAGVSSENFTNPANFNLGYDNGSNYYKGLLDEVRIYNRALSGTEITNLYQTSAKASMNTSENSDLTNGLVGLWSFNGADVSGTTAYDRSGQGNNGTLTNGPTVTTGKIGQALDFDGTDDRIVVGDINAMDGLTYMTASAWVKYDNVGVYKGIVTKVNGVGWALETGSSGSTFVGGFNDGYGIAGTVPNDTWTHLVFTFDGTQSGNASRLKMYMNGTQVTPSYTGTVPAVAPSNAFDVVIGGGVDPRYFSGQIDEVRVYNRTLSATEIWNLYQAGGGTRVNSANSQVDALERGLAGYWKLDDGSGTTATDASTNGNTGTLTNGPTWTTGQIGGAVSFDGTNDMIAITDSAVLDTGGVGSWCNWFYTDTNQSGVNTGFSHNTGGGTYAVIGSYLTSSSGALAGYVRIAGVAYSATTPVYSSGYWNGAWHHVCTTFDKNLSSGRLKLYVDGVIAGSNNAASGDIDAGITPVIGAWKNSGPFEYFNGDTDEVRVYTRALSAEEIAKLYQSTAPDNPDTGLKGYWSFNGPDVSGTTASDRSGQGNNGTLTNGPTVTTGKIGQALSFDGSNDCVTLGTLHETGALTLSAWIYPNSVSGRQVIVGKLESGASFPYNYGYGMLLAGSTLIGMAATDSYDWYSNLNATVQSGVWQHVVFTITGSSGTQTGTLYVNGVLADSHSGTASVYLYNPAIGCGLGNGSGGTFNGKIDEVRSYSRALSATEVTNLYNLGR